MPTRSSRRLIWSLVLVAVVVNLPVLMSLATRARIAADGVPVTAEVVGGRLYGEESDPEYWLGYRFPEDVDEDREVFSVEVDRATYAAASESRELSARVVPGSPVAHRVEGAEPRRLGLWLTLGADVLLVLLVALWWRRRRRRAEGHADDAPDADEDPLPERDA